MNETAIKDDNNIDNKNHDLSLDEMSTEEIIRTAGGLNYTEEKLITILYNRLDKQELMRVALALRTKNSDEWKLFHSGGAETEFTLQARLQMQASFDKDMYTAYNTERRRQEINNALREKFDI